MKSKKLKKAEVAMLLASIDYDDNLGSADRYEFWDKFEEARDNYKAVKRKEESKSK